MPKPRTIPIAEVREWDTVCLTGITRQRGIGVRVENLIGVIGTVSRAADGPAAIKLWPDAGHPDPSGCGKIWFWIADIEKVELLDREEE